MNPQTQKESDLLALLDKSEEEQKAYLISNKIMQYHPLSEHIKDATYRPFPQIWESLADLDDRLWGKATKQGCYLVITLTEVTEKTTGIKPMKRESIEAWWIYNARPIHRIIAALIALKRSGVEELTNL